MLEDELLDFVIDKLCYTTKKDFSNEELMAFIKSVDLDLYDKEYLFKTCFELTSQHPVIRGRGIDIREAILKYLKPTLPFVYKLYEKDVLVYVGLSTNINKRIKGHTNVKDFDNIKLYKCHTEDEMKFLESWLILKYLPEGNGIVNLNYARSYKGEEPIFVSPEDLDYSLIPAIAYTKENDSLKSYFYSRSCSMYIKNDRGVVPFWFK